MLRWVAQVALWSAFAAVPAYVIYLAVRRHRSPFPRVIWLLMMLLVLAGGLIPLIDAAEYANPWVRPLALTLRFLVAGLAWWTLIVILPAIPALLENFNSDKLRTHIHERERAESLLRETEEAHSSLLDALPVNIFRKDQQGRLTFGNKRYFETLGRPPEEVIGQTDQDLFRPEQANKYRADDERVLLSGESLETIEEHRRPGGDIIYVQVFKAPIRNSRGKIIGTQGMFWDVTARVQAEQAARKSDMRFRQLLNSSLIGMVVNSLDGRILDANDYFLEMTGYLRDDITSGRLRWDELTPPEHREADLRAIELLRKNGTCPPWEKEYIRRDGSRVPILIGVTMLEGSETECVSFVVDHTEHREHERALESAKEAADAANQAKSQFLANMSHEVRTPLNAVIGLTELVLKSSLSPKHREFLELSLQSAESLLSLINDILDFSKVEAGKLELQAEPFSLRDTVGDAVRALAVRAHEKGLELVCHISPQLPERVVGDAGKLRQILTNLVGNAVKFTPTGEVVVRVEERERTPNTSRLRFEVRDTGIGIPTEMRERIFDPFEQADSTTTRQYGGTGLGLAIVRRLVDLKGGAIELYSEVGVGSVFAFTVELPRVESAREPVTSALNGRRILVVDDNATNRLILEETLASWELNVTACASAAAARDALQRARDQGESYDVVLTDFQMPGEDGLSLARSIAAAPDAPPVILLTSGQHREDDPRRDAVAAWMLKPVKQSELLNTLLTTLHLVSPAAQPPSTVPRVAGRALRLLLAEDSAVNQRLVIGLLEQHGHSLKIVDTGWKAVAASAEELFDAILMDVQMPEMDGLEATRKIREREAAGRDRVPIIAMTAHALPGDRERCLESGMDEYLTKPVREAKLLEALSRLAGAPAPTENAAPTVSPEDMNGLVDWAVAMEVCNGDQALLRDIVEAFMEEYPLRIAEIERALAENNPELLNRAAHTIKGAMRYFGAELVFDRAFALEQIGATKELTPGHEAFAALQRELSRLLPQMHLFLEGKTKV